MSIVLRPYQQVGVESIRACFAQKKKRVLFVMPTGAGKTVTFCYIAQNAAAKKNNVIIIVHRKELLLQASKALRGMGIDHGMISPHFTPAPYKMVQVASVDTLLIRMKKQPDKYNYKLAIFDEAHHVTKTNKWGKVLELLRDPVTLGVTATPIRGDGTGLGEGHGGVFQDMVLGPTVGELIEWGMLVNPTVYTSVNPPEFDDLKPNKEGDYNVKEVEARVDRPVITGSAVAQYTKICPGVRAIVFCASIKHAKNVVAEFNAAGYRFSLLVGEPEMSDAERTEVNKKLESGELDGACTVALVDEGYDLPLLQCCIVLAPTGSLSRFLQRVGRIMRPAPGKSSANTFYLDHVGDVGREKNGEFVVKHGFPNSPRPWGLGGRKKGKKKKKDDDTIPIKQCAKCYHVFEFAHVCPACGHDMTPKGREIVQVDGDLHQVTIDMARQKIEKKKQVAAARTLEELKQIEKDRKYKPGWANHIYNSRPKAA